MNRPASRRVPSALAGLPMAEDLERLRWRGHLRLGGWPAAYGLLPIPCGLLPVAYAPDHDVPEADLDSRRPLGLRPLQ